MDNGSSSKIEKKRLVGEGFFNGSGRLKSKEELRTNVEKSSTDQASSSSISNVLSKVDQRFRADVSTAANDLNRREAQVKQTRVDLKAEKKALNNLKDAFESDDPQKIEAAQAELEEVRIIRTERQTQVEKEQRSAGAIRSVSIGNSEQGRVILPEIKVSKVETKAPANKKEAREQLEAVKQDIESVNSLKDPLTQARAVLSELYESGQKSLAKVGQASVDSLASAQQLVSKITEETKDLTSSELISAAFGKASNSSASMSLAF